MCDDDAMKPKFSFIEITPISKVSSISAIKCEGRSFNTIKDSTRFFESLGLVFNRLSRTYGHKLSTSFAVMVGNNARVLQTSFDGLSLISSVAILFQTAPRCVNFFLVLRQGRVVMLATSFQDFMFVYNSRWPRLTPFIGTCVAKGVQVGVCKSVRIAFI